MVAIAAIFFAGAGSALALNNSAFVSQSVPTTMVVGTTYTVSVTLQNTGDTTWTSAAFYRLGPQNPHENPAFGVGRVHLTGSVAPAANVTITFNVVAPNTAGTYNFQWRMLQENGNGWFGALTTNVAVTVTGVNQAQYVYDEIGRLVEVVAPNGVSARYAYDPVGNITSISQNSATTVSIAEFTPNGGPAGTPVTIYGSGYSTTPASNTVKFSVTNATVTAATPTSLTVTVPTGAATGKISVSNTNGTGTSLSDFTVGAITPAAPTITGFTPASGIAGTPVTITGTGFQTTTVNNQLRFGIWASPISSATATTIVTTVPTAAPSGRISVTTPYGVATSAADFYGLPGNMEPSSVEIRTRLTVGAASPTPITTTAYGGKILLIFDGTQGQWVSLALTGGNFAGYLPAVIYRLDGAMLSSRTMGNNDRLDFRVPMAGTYGILFTPGPLDRGTVNVQLKAAATGTLTPSVASTFTLAVGQIGVYSFPAKPADVFGLTVSSLTVPGTTIAVILAEGSPVSSTVVNTSGAEIGPVRVEAGSNAVFVQPAVGAPGGSVTLRLTPGPDLVMSVPTIGAVTVDYNGAYTFPVTYTVTNNGGLPTVSSQGAYWYDRCYLSADGSLDVTDPLIGANTRSAPLAAGASYTVTMTCTTTNTTAPGPYRVFVRADGGYSGTDSWVLESNETNNAASVAVTLPPRADFVAGVPTIGAITVLVDGAYSFPVTFTVTNIGGSPGNLGSMCYLSSDTILDAPDLGLGGSNGTTLAPGASYTASMTCTTPKTTTAGPYRLFVKVGGSTVPWSWPPVYSPAPIPTDSNISNNAASAALTLPVKPPLPDLVVSAVTIGAITTNPNGSHYFNVTYTVTNASPTQALSYWYDQCYLSSDTTLDSSDRYLQGSYRRDTTLAPNASYTMTLTCITLAGTTPGTYRVFVKADAGANAGFYSASEQLTEQNESNNAVSVQVVLPAPGPTTPPDLTVSGLTIGAITTNANGSHSIPVTYTVNNINPGTAQTSWWDECFLSADTILDTSDRYIGYGSRTAGLAGNSSYTNTITCTTPAGTVPGTYRLFMKADGYDNGTYYTAQSQLTESNETNNAASVQVVLPAYTPPSPPDLTVSGVTIGTITAFANGSHSFPVTFTVNNINAYTAPPSWYDECYLSADTILDTSDRKIGQGYRSTPLGGNSSYTSTITCTTPGGTVPGTYRLFMKADGYDNGTYYTATSLVTESNEANNAVSVAVVLPAYTAPLPADLIVTATSVGAITKSADGSHSFPVTFTVKNNGAGATQSSWYDECFLSSDTTLDTSDRWLLGYNYRTTPLAATTSYTTTITCRTPPATAPGSYQLIMKADAYDNGTYYTAQSLQTESNEANNTMSVPLVLP